MSPARLLALGAIGLIRCYQFTLSPFVGRGCRHLPTCSHFTADAIGRHGLWAGGWMGLARICRCNPFGSSGWDPVPDAKPPAARWWTPWAYGDWRGGYRPAAPSSVYGGGGHEVTGGGEETNPPSVSRSALASPPVHGGAFNKKRSHTDAST